MKLLIDASRNRSGGAIIYLKNFITHLDFNKSSITEIIICSYNDLLNKLPKTKNIIKYNHPFLEKNILFQIFWQLFLLPNYLDRENVDILYTTDASTFCHYSPNIVFNQDLMSFSENEMSETSLFSKEKFRNYFIKKIQIKALNKADEIIFNSKESKRLISKYLKKDISSSIIYHGIDTNIINLAEENIFDHNWVAEEKKEINLIYVSPLYKYKNHSTVAKAYEILQKKYKNLNIKFIGNYKNNLNLYKDIINRNKAINKSNFLGEVSHDQVIKEIYGADIFIFASNVESFGITLVEAMAIGIPIVCSDRSSLPEILKNGGLYFDPKKVSDLVEKIEILIKNADLRKKLSIESKLISHEYTWDNNVEQFNKIINKLII